MCVRCSYIYIAIFIFFFNNILFLGFFCFYWFRNKVLIEKVVFRHIFFILSVYGDLN